MINHNFKRLLKRPAFTLVELLTALAIIGILVTIAVISFNNIRASARDSTRLTDITQIAIALEKYYNANLHYPYCNGGDASLTSDWYTCLGPALKPYLNSMPRDPSAKAMGYSYRTANHPVHKSQVVYLEFPLERPNPNLSSASFRWYSGHYGLYLYSRAFGRY